MARKWKPSKTQQAVIDYMRETGKTLRIDCTFAGGTRLRDYPGRLTVSTAHSLKKHGVIEMVPGEQRVWYENEYRLSNAWKEVEVNDE